MEKLPTISGIFPASMVYVVALDDLIEFYLRHFRHRSDLADGMQRQRSN